MSAQTKTDGLALVLVAYLRRKFLDLGCYFQTFVVDAIRNYRTLVLETSQERTSLYVIRASVFSGNFSDF